MSLDNEKSKNKKSVVAMYTRVGNYEQLDSYKEEKIQDENDNQITGLYIRTVNFAENEEELRELIYQQKNALEKYCEDNNIKNTILYFDIREGANSSSRQAFNEMLEDISKGKIQTVIVTCISRIHRNLVKLISLLKTSSLKDAKIITLDGSYEDMKNKNDRIINEIEDTIKLNQIDFGEDEEIL